MRLIDADELKKKFAYITHVRFTADMGQGGFEMFSEKEIEDIINKSPTVKTYCYFCGQTEHGQIEEKPRGEWTPVSKGLPEIGVDVIVTDIETTGTYSAYYLGDGFWACDNGTHKNRIIAWMPFPEPYKKKEVKNNGANNT